jgi:WD40 repeat protein
LFLSIIFFWSLKARSNKLQRQLCLKSGYLMRLLYYFSFLFVTLTGALCQLACAQVDANARSVAGPCGIPTYDSILREENIFSEQQEEWLGEILAPQVENAFKTVPDPEHRLQKLADKLLAQLPPSNIHYRLSIIDLPENNSFGIPGGHIYVSRRIIALARDEDELAGLIGHEIGHIITRQPAIDLTRALQNVLGVSSLGDRKNVEEQWNRLLDMAATKRWTDSRKREEAEQQIADRIAIYAMARAGYQPSKFAEFFDRLAQTKGNKGSFWTDLFGRTSNDARRLRELVRTAVPLGQNCFVAATTPVDTEQFVKWQKEVIASDFAMNKESIPGLISKQSLKPPLRSDLSTVRFSPDGRYLVAHDENSIYLLTARPVTNVFRIDVSDASEPEFTPDSSAIVFYDKELRVQKWDIAGKRTAIHELALPIRCIETELSHSGDVFACLDQELQPQLFDVKTSSLIYKGRKIQAESNNWQVVLQYQAFSPIGGGLPMHFSPDDHYFLIGHENAGCAYDLRARSEIEIARNVKELASLTFTFISPDEIAGYQFHKGRSTIAIAHFPSGEIQNSFPWGFAGVIGAPEKGNYLFLVREQNPVVTVLDRKTGKPAMIYKKPGFDIYDDVFAGETAGGEIGIYDVAAKKYQGGVDLPNGVLSFATASAFSANGKWLALSQRTRGAVWNLETGDRTFLTRGFQGAFFDQDQLFAKFPKQGSAASAVFRLDGVSKNLQSLYELKNDAGTIMREDQGAFYWQQGDVLLRGSRVTGKNKKQETQFLVEIFDVRTNTKLWERKPRRELPYIIHSTAGKTMTVLTGDYADMKAEAHDDAALSAKLSALADENRRKASYIIETMDDATGKELGKLLVDTGNLSFKILSAVTVGDCVLLRDSNGRTLIYSLKTGEQKAAIPGTVLAISNDGSKILLEDGRGKANLYELSTLRSLSHFEFPFPVVHAEFSAVGDTIQVLTGDQTIYRLKAGPEPKSVAVQ